LFERERVNASTWVCGCGSPEKINHLFFNCPAFAVVWNKTLKWPGIQTAFFYGGFIRLKQFKGLVLSNKKVKDILGLIWCANISNICKAKNAMIFNQDGLIGKKYWTGGSKNLIMELFVQGVQVLFSV